MRLDFNVLWVEDQPDAVVAQMKAIDREMAEEGFTLKPFACQTLDEVTAYIGEDVFRDEIDLILVDWDLGKGVQGQDVIASIRREVPYKDVVFYSAVTDIKELQTAAYEAELEGIYFVHRNDLVHEVGQLFRTMIKKVLDLDHTRGIVMGATSDVDQMVRECLVMAYGLLDEAGQRGVHAEVVSLLEAKLPSLEKSVGKLRGKAALEIIEEHRTFTANDGLRILTRVLELEPLQAHKHHQDGLRKYIADVVPKRNILGDVTPVSHPAITRVLG